MAPAINHLSRRFSKIYQVLALCLLSTCLIAQEPASTQTDIPYLGSDRAEKLDVYLPSAAYSRPRPAVIFIHGGGWTGGSKSDGRSREFCNALADRGYVAFSIDYLLNKASKDESGKTRIDQVVWPQNFYDCKTAVRFVRKHAEEFGVDPSRIAVMGASAGAHLALLVAATKDAADWNKGGLYLAESNDVAAVVEFYGRHDVTLDRRMHFSGATPEETEANVIAASPVTHITSQMPPVLAVQGDKDTIVPVTYGRRLTDRLRELHVPFEYIEIPGAEHSFGLTPPQMDLQPALFAFLEKYLGGRASETPPPTAPR